VTRAGVSAHNGVAIPFWRATMDSTTLIIIILLILILGGGGYYGRGRWW
jgi:hypothetical protein